MKRVLFFLFSFLIGFFIFSSVIKWVKWQEIKEIFFTFSYWKWMVILGATLLIWFDILNKTGNKIFPREQVKKVAT